MNTSNQLRTGKRLSQAPTTPGDPSLQGANLTIPLDQNPELIRELLGTTEGCLRVIKEVDPGVLIEGGPGDARLSSAVENAVLLLSEKNAAPEAGVYEFFCDLLTTPRETNSSLNVYLVNALAEWSDAASQELRDKAHLSIMSLYTDSRFLELVAIVGVKAIKSKAGEGILRNAIQEALQPGKLIDSEDTPYLKQKACYSSRYLYCAIYELNSLNPSAAQDIIRNAHRSVNPEVSGVASRWLMLLPPSEAKDAVLANLASTNPHIRREDLIKSCITLRCVTDALAVLEAKAFQQHDSLWSFAGILEWIKGGFSSQSHLCTTQSLDVLQEFARRVPQEIPQALIDRLTESVKSGKGSSAFRSKCAEILGLLKD